MSLILDEQEKISILFALQKNNDRVLFIFLAFHTSVFLQQNFDWFLSEKVYCNSYCF